MNQSALAGFIKIVELNSFSAAAEALYSFPVGTFAADPHAGRAIAV